MLPTLKLIPLDSSSFSDEKKDKEYNFIHSIYNDTETMSNLSESCQLHINQHYQEEYN